jgi:hypothetical protein
VGKIELSAQAGVDPRIIGHDLQDIPDGRSSAYG